MELQIGIKRKEKEKAGVPKSPVRAKPEYLSISTRPHAVKVSPFLGTIHLLCGFGRTVNGKLQQASFHESSVLMYNFVWF